MPWPLMFEKPKIWQKSLKTCKFYKKIAKIRNDKLLKIILLPLEIMQ